MKDMTAAITHSPVTKPRQNAAIAVLRRCGEMLIDVLKSMSAAWCDPMTCSAYWIGADPTIGGVRN